MDCPNCGSEMRERDRAGVKIDFCPSCKGVWLDRGELDKIIALESRDDFDWDERRPSRDRGRAEQDRERYDDRGRKKSKKKSFFESVMEMAGGGED